MNYIIEMVKVAQEDCKDNPKLFEMLLEDAERPFHQVIDISQVVQSKSKIWVV